VGILKKVRQSCPGTRNTTRTTRVPDSVRSMEAVVE